MFSGNAVYIPPALQSEMTMIEDVEEVQLALEMPADPDERQARIEAERAELLAAVDANELDTLSRKVTWVLNYFPEARDSDITLMLHFWDTFSDIDTSDGIQREDLYKLPRLTSLARARAKIQNTYRLFEASAPVRKQRGQLAADERERLAEESAHAPAYAVFLDESGKTATHLILGSVWVLHPSEIVRLLNAVQAWRKSNAFEGEFHFKEINDGNLRHYISFADFVHSEASVLTFRALTCDRRGLKNIDEMIEKLLYHLLLRGVQHENDTGRASLPRTLIVEKDADAPGSDSMMLAQTSDRLKAASLSQLGGKLSLSDFKAVNSKGQPLIQVADLIAGSLNRIKNGTDTDSAKDKFAKYFLGKLGMPSGPTTPETVGDIAVLMSI
jgi:hypothetical protein